METFTEIIVPFEAYLDQRYVKIPRLLVVVL